MDSIRIILGSSLELIDQTRIDHDLEDHDRIIIPYERLEMRGGGGGEIREE